MARLLPPVCRLCRREGMKLFLKGMRCDTKKCAIEKESRNSPPGMHSWRKSKASEYGLRLREKQKVKRYYGVMERQFTNYFAIVSHAKGNTGELLMSLLERRLDNIVYKSGMTSSRKMARQIITHGHIHVNGRKTQIPSYILRQGDVVSIKQSDKVKNFVKSQLDMVGSSRSRPSWINFDGAKYEFTLLGLPTREDVDLSPINEQMIVELCTR